MARNSLDQADPKTLATLLAPADEEHIWSDADMAALMRQQLESPLPAVAGDPSTSVTIAELLAQPKPSLDLLVRLKEFAKAARKDVRSGIPPQISSALYYSAIFVAQMRLGAKLTQLDAAALLQGAEFLLLQPWLDARIRQILEGGSALL